MVIQLDFYGVFGHRQKIHKSEIHHKSETQTFM